MPRRNRTIPHTTYNAHSLAHTQPKRAYQTKQAAETAIKESEKYNLELTLHSYQSLVDGKWYLSSKQKSNK
ncbi:MAG: hypothetical protein ABIP74_04080 [Candidatus Saccharimonas sp.]